MYCTQSVGDVLSTLKSTSTGLATDEAIRRIKEYGYNELPEKKRSLLLLFLKQFNSVLVYILIGALVLSIVLPFYEHASSGLSTGHGEMTLMDFMDAITIGAILILNALLGFFQEKKAENAIAILQKMSAPTARVRRNGEVHIIPSRELVPGDILLLEEGDRISADGRVLSTSNSAIDEASLTGESKPSRKKSDALTGNPALGDQINMVFKGTVVTAGRLEVAVSGTGLQTEIGHIADLVSTVEHPPTPLEKSMASLGKWLGIVVMVFCSIIFIVGMIRDLPIGEMLLAAASLAVSAVPEGLPAIVTVCLAIGVQRMIKRNVLTRELQAIETLGSVTVICTDKTGTLTENEMEVQEICAGGVTACTVNVRNDIAGQSSKDIKAIELLLEIAASCNNAHSLEVGDPTEIGLLEAAQKANVPRRFIKTEDVPFSSNTMYMMTTHEIDGKNIQYLKGALETILALSTHILEDGKEIILTDDARTILLSSNAEMAANALRILGFAYRKPYCHGERSRTMANDVTSFDYAQDDTSHYAQDDTSKTVFVGLVGMLDPPRASVKDSIALAQRAGIRTVMITGDHELTARAIGKRIGIVSDAMRGDQIENLSSKELQEIVKTVSIFARVSPTHKVRILEALQANGEIAAMGGDGVNDAPALKRAHVGFAMGQRGTDVARETAEIVLTDDHYESIVAAIEEGRTIYDNINKFVVFLLRANFDELAVVFISIIGGIPLPYLPIHILVINLMTDSLPAIALAMEKPEADIMLRPPRDPKEHILHGEVLFIILAATVATMAAFHIFYVMGGMDGSNVDLARTMVVVNSILFELTLVFACRSKHSLLEIGLFTNRYLIGAVSIAFVLLLLCVYTPINVLLHFVPLSAEQWILPLVWSFGALLFFETLKILFANRRMTW